MRLLEHLRTKLRRLVSGTPHARAMQTMAAEKEGGAFRGEGSGRAHAFERDYHAATALLRERMNARYPDAYHGRLGSTENPTYGHGEARIDVVDTASTAVAMALRGGATVEEAAEMGAASVGL